MCICERKKEERKKKKKTSKFSLSWKEQAGVNQLKGREISARHRNNKIKPVLTIIIIRHSPWKVFKITTAEPLTSFRAIN